MRRCCVINCNPEATVSFHSLPADFDLNLKWREILANYTVAGLFSDHSLVCSNHFSEDSFFFTRNRKVLIAGAIPSIFKLPKGNPSHSENVIPQICDASAVLSLFKPGNENPSLSENLFPQISDASTQTTNITTETKDLAYTNKCLAQKLKRMQSQCNRLKKELIVQKEENKKQCQDSDWKHLQQIKADANQMNPRATFILDQIKNYQKKTPRWSETTIRHCIAWKFCSSKGYKFPGNTLLKLPCETTLKKYMGTNNKNLIKDRLMSEIEILSAPERVCSLILDDMAVREAVIYSKAEDRIFGLETISQSHKEIGNKPIIANQLLCYVIYGLSTKYIIPASYHFHKQLNAKDLFKLTLDVLKLLADCGFKVIRIVADNHKYHVALFKHFGNGMLENVLPHPYNPGLKLFLSFDHCHAIKNARNLLLERDMVSSDGIISADYLKELATIQEHLIIKPVRYLTKKHLYPSNLEKMKVKLAIQIFSPPVTAALKYLVHHGGEQFSYFKDCIATVTYMENMYKYFQIHDVSNRIQHIHQRDPNTAPYTDTQDARLSWLNLQFPHFIADIQSSSAKAGLPGLTKETAEALVFTARSTYLCIQYLIRDLNFYYVLTRSFNSDAVESVFANIRLRGGSNDLTDCRAAEYAIRQILRSGFIKNVNNSNSMSEVKYASTAKFLNTEHNIDDFKITIILNDATIEKLERMSIFEGSYIGFHQIESAAVAFLCGYLIMKVQESLNCETCLLALRDNSCDKTNPLLDLIYNQDRGRLNYPTEKFVGLVQYIIQVTLEVLPSLPKQDVDSILKRVIGSYLRGNPLFKCKLHSNTVCNIILTKLIPPLLINFCNLQTQNVRKKCNNIYTKKRKLLKLN